MADVPVERLQAAIRLLFPEEMTPTAKRVLEDICDAASDVLTEYYVAELLRSDPDTIHDVAGPCEWNYHRGIPDGSRCRCGKLRAGEGAS